MRPRKPVLCVHQDIDDLGVLRVIINARGHYQTTTVHTRAEAIQKLSESYFDAALVHGGKYEDGADAEDVIRAIKDHSGDIKVILHEEGSSKENFSTQADTYIPEQKKNIARLLMQLGLFTQRKRGPKPLNNSTLSKLECR